jgi:hypothetical protein
MITIKTFNKGFGNIQLVFEFQPDPVYQNLIYNALKEKLNDKLFLDTCNNILQSTTKEDWNNAYGYKGRPAVADWLDAFIPKMQDTGRTKICELTNQRVKVYEYPESYLEFLNEQKRGKVEASDRVNQKKVEGIIKTITTKN